MVFISIPRKETRICPKCNSKIINAISIYGLEKCCVNDDCDIKINGYGIFSDKKTRSMRNACHKKFDRIWKNNEMSRTNAYKWLASVMKLTEEDAHIGKMNFEQCIQLMSILHDRTLGGVI